MELTVGYIDSLAPNPAAIANGKALVKKGNYKELHTSADGVLLFGKCSSSGVKIYSCSMDFIDAAKPIPRCDCPSRQFPCKHVMGLLYAYVQGSTFTESDIPAEIVLKREIAEKLANYKAKKLEKEEKKQKNILRNKAIIVSATKKIDVQLEGIEIAEKLLKNIIKTGLAGIDARSLSAVKDQITQLGNYRIRGIQTAFGELHMFIGDDDPHFTGSISQIIFLRALLKKAREHLTAKKQNTEDILRLDTTTEIEEQIDHIWKLEELHTYKRYISQADVVQLSFNVYDDPAKKELVDTGYVICLQNGKIYTTKNYRPYKSLKYIDQDDSIMEPLVVDNLYIYPGDGNPRVRFSKHIMRPWTPKDYITIKSHASGDFAMVVKSVKNLLKSPLADKNPVVLLKINSLAVLKDAQNQEYMSITDTRGTSQLLQGNTLPVLVMIDKALLCGHALLVKYENDIHTGLLTAKPLSIITDDRVIRLEY
ncbi:MAG: SWIM zinc finger family protein [Defluviitaleaceae bacterium]|nr:SWIM zinc finger family protein [Defluviitaleaceae bacterium]